nr:hypothetical protein CFP56_04568 [Quercus suber]
MTSPTVRDPVEPLDFFALRVVQAHPRRKKATLVWWGHPSVWSSPGLVSFGVIVMADFAAPGSHLAANAPLGHRAVIGLCASLKT